MTDLLTPEETRLIQADVWHKYDPRVGRLCQNYLTLWDRWTFAADFSKKRMADIKRLDEIILGLEEEIDRRDLNDEEMAERMNA